MAQNFTKLTSFLDLPKELRLQTWAYALFPTPQLFTVSVPRPQWDPLIAKRYARSCNDLWHFACTPKRRMPDNMFTCKEAFFVAQYRGCVYQATQQGHEVASERIEGSRPARDEVWRYIGQQQERYQPTMPPRTKSIEISVWCGALDVVLLRSDFIQSPIEMTAFPRPEPASKFVCYAMSIFQPLVFAGIRFLIIDPADLRDLMFDDSSVENFVFENLEVLYLTKSRRWDEGKNILPGR